MADRYETDTWLVGELWKRCREMEDQITELKKDLSVAEEFSRKITKEQEYIIIDLEKQLKEVTDHRDRLILESVDAGRPMPSHKPEPEPEPEPEEKPAEVVLDLGPMKAEVAYELKTKGKRSIFSDQDVEDIKNRYLSGETSTSIAVDYDCAGSTINKLMSKHGVRKQTHEKTVRWIDKGKVWALHDAGWDTKKICEEFVAADATPEKIEEILAKPRPGRPGRKKKVVEE